VPLDATILQVRTQGLRQQPRAAPPVCKVAQTTCYLAQNATKRQSSRAEQDSGCAHDARKIKCCVPHVQVGVGTSEMQREMVEDGYRLILNTDTSAVAVGPSKPYMKYIP